MPNRAAIRDYVRQLTLLETDDISNDKINPILDQGVREASSRFHWPFLQASSTVTVVDGTHVYSLPSDFQYLHTLIRDDTRIRLREVSASKAWNALGDSFPSGQAESFFLWEEQLHLTKIPSADETLNIKYFKSPTVMSDDTHTPEWDEQFHLIIADYAISKLWEREEDSIKSAEAMQKFDQGVEQMARWYNDKASDLPMVYGESPTVGAHVDNMPWLSDAGLL